MQLNYSFAIFNPILLARLPPSFLQLFSIWCSGTETDGLNHLFMSFPLQTLGHLEKAVVLELTLKHVKALTSLIEQQQQQIIALQKGLHAGESSDHFVSLNKGLGRLREITFLEHVL